MQRSKRHVTIKFGNKRNSFCDQTEELQYDIVENMKQDEGEILLSQLALSSFPFLSHSAQMIKEFNECLIVFHRSY